MLNFSDGWCDESAEKQMLRNVTVMLMHQWASVVQINIQAYFGRKVHKHNKRGQIRWFLKTFKRPAIMFDAIRAVRVNLGGLQC